MFNDEIELVRLKAINSLRQMSANMELREDQLESVLSVLEVRERERERVCVCVCVCVCEREREHVYTFVCVCVGESICIHIPIQYLKVTIICGYKF